MGGTPDIPTENIAPIAPVAETKTAPLVSVSAVPLRRRVLKGISSSVPVMINIETGSLPKSDTKARVPLNLAIVLDQSGSMSGKKLEHSKLAVMKIIENLHVTDILHFVVYGSRVTTVFENQTMRNKSALTSKVRNVRTQGCTNLSGGLQQASELLQKYAQNGYSNRMFLFSDGQANEGIQDVDGMSKLVSEMLQKHKIKVDSFGIGDDFDADMMRNIAEYGSGAFSFIDSPESIPDLVSKSLHGLLELVGQETRLVVRGLGPALVKKFYGRDQADLTNGANLGDLHQDNTRKQMAEVEVSVRGDAMVDEEMQVMEWEVSYVPYDNPNTRRVVRGAVTLSVVESREELEAEEENAEVKVQLTHLQSADMDTMIEQSIKAGKAAEALEQQTKQMELLQACAKFDKSDDTKTLLNICSKQRVKLQAQGASKEMLQCFSHAGYMKKRGSKKFMARFS